VNFVNALYVDLKTKCFDTWELKDNRLFSLLQNLLFAQHVLDTIMPIIRISRVIQMVVACGTWRFGLQVMCPVCGMLQHPANRTHNRKPKRQVPQATTICITLEILMMGIMVPETCWTNNKFCNKETNLLHLIGLLIHTY